MAPKDAQDDLIPVQNARSSQKKEDFLLSGGIPGYNREPDAW
ncbi:hypothetical protein [Cytobacillus oceanisediminis]|nr:hypothetical protein [Cytobacillus oceanisediminis]